METLKSIFAVNMKDSGEAYSDQFNSRVMTKILLLCAIITSIDYFSDNINCMSPMRIDDISYTYVQQTCWTKGLFIYKELEQRPEISLSRGIPKDISKTGLDNFTDDPCNLVSVVTGLLSDSCLPMAKEYYIQYQYVPLYLLVLSLLYYLPHLVAFAVDSDIRAIQNSLHAHCGDVNRFVSSYFAYNKRMSVWHFRIKTWMNIAVKCLHIYVSVYSYQMTNSILSDRFRNYGSDMVNSLVNLNQRNSSEKFNLPGNNLLPTVGLCEFDETTSSRLSSFSNKHLVMCELSTHVLYQYVFLVLWHCMVASITISVLGLLVYLCRCLYFCVPLPCTSKSLSQDLTLRHMDHLDFIKDKDIVMYIATIKMLDNNGKEGSMQLDALNAF